jgi:hypothetical protein
VEIQARLAPRRPRDVIRESMDDLFAMGDLRQMGSSMLAKVIHGSVARRAGIMRIIAETQMAPAAAP